MKLEKTASGSKKITIARKEWESIGIKSGWMKTAQAPQQAGAAPAQPAQPMAFSAALAKYPDLKKAFENVRVSLPFLKKLLANYNVAWQNDPTALEVLG